MKSNCCLAPIHEEEIFGQGVKNLCEKCANECTEAKPDGYMTRVSFDTKWDDMHPNQYKAIYRDRRVAEDVPVKLVALDEDGGEG